MQTCYVLLDIKTKPEHFQEMKDFLTDAMPTALMKLEISCFGSDGIQGITMKNIMLSEKLLECLKLSQIC